LPLQSQLGWETRRKSFGSRCATGRATAKHEQLRIMANWPELLDEFFDDPEVEAV
jgi:hypothetical protein